MSELIYKKEAFEIIGICMEIHRILGHGFSEVVYKDAMEYEFLTTQILFAREKEYEIKYKDIILKHKYFADFVVFDKIILEVKAAEGGIDDATISQTLNYLKVS